MLQVLCHESGGTVEVMLELFRVLTVGNPLHLVPFVENVLNFGEPPENNILVSNSADLKESIIF